MHLKGTRQAGSNTEELLMMMILFVHRQYGQVIQSDGSSAGACVSNCTYHTLVAYLVDCTYLTDCIYLTSGKHFGDCMYLLQGEDALSTS